MSCQLSRTRQALLGPEHHWGADCRRATFWPCFWFIAIVTPLCVLLSSHVHEYHKVWVFLFCGMLGKWSKIPVWCVGVLVLVSDLVPFAPSS